MPPSRKTITYQPLVKPAEGVQALFQGASQTSRQLEMTPYRRREHARQKNRNKVAYDLRPELTTLIDQILDAFKTTPASITPFSKSALIELLIIHGLQSIERSHGSIYGCIEDLLRPTTTPRFEWQLDIPPVPGIIIRKRKR